jgi:hypothetical protein
VEVAAVKGWQLQALDRAEIKVESAVAVPLSSATRMKRATAPESNLFLTRLRLNLASAVTAAAAVAVTLIVLVVVVVTVVYVLVTALRRSGRSSEQRERYGLRYGSSINGEDVRRVAQEPVAEFIGVGVLVDLCVDIVLNADLFLTSSETKQISNEVHDSIGTGFRLDTLLLISGSSGDELEQSKAQNEG